ncbi:DUF222 domain-containing protein [Streptomyces sp. NP160]|uniref:HNH endonuclease signature motif containing protein n=1 Tax=Streptomyces sp. NP160 TaxID=2586637 RepID=UPI001118B3B6|nr:HNH endonuclease signature motif containing protein [Streptomyces sp. NP160]TNM68786.1 DUF222 domain-containing protein [Streptomyces sp. NP160]
MTSTTPSSGRLGAALADAQAALREVVEACGWVGTLAPADRAGALQEAVVLGRMVDAAVLQLMASFTRSDLDEVGAANPVGLLTGSAGYDPAAAKRLEVVSRATGAGDVHQPPMPEVAALHAAGRISTDVFEVAARLLRVLPRAVRRNCGAELDRTLAQDLPGLTHEQAVQLCRELREVLDPKRADGDFDPDALERRGLEHTVHEDGWVSVRGNLDPLNGAQFLAAIDHFSKPAPTAEVEIADDDVRPGAWGAEPQLTKTVRDERTASQRRADALGLIALTASDPGSTRGGEPPRIVVTVTGDQLRELEGAGRAVCEQTGPLPTAVMRTVVSRGVLQAVVLSAEGAGATVLALGRSVRCFTPPQRRALYARDGGCVIPGCDAKLAWLEAHHVVEWQAGGPTDVENGVLLCPRHHLQVGMGVWEVRVVDGVPRVRPPATVDHLRRWLVNPRRAVRETARERGRQLKFEDPPGRAAWAPPPPSAEPQRSAGPQADAPCPS